MKIKFNEEEGYTLTVTKENYPNPQRVYVSFDNIVDIISKLNSLCLDSKKDRQILLEHFAEHAIIMPR